MRLPVLLQCRLLPRPRGPVYDWAVGRCVCVSGGGGSDRAGVGDGDNLASPIAWGWPAAGDSQSPCGLRGQHHRRRPRLHSACR